jgi:NADH-quinone oxidoreductase subunit C
MALSNEIILETAKKADESIETYEFRNQFSLITSREKVVEVCKMLKESDETSFDMLVDTTAIDWYDKKKPRYEVVYFLYSNKYHSRVRVKLPLDAKDLHTPTLTSVWESANWYERETYDMYGIIFDGHPDMRRFYMPEDYADPETGEPIYPLRKDFPLMGVPDSLPLPPYPEKYGDLR